MSFPTIYNIKTPVLREKMAGFDYDWTLVNPKEGKTFPSSVDDWLWLYPNVPKKIQQYYAMGYMIVIFTNQSKKWKHEQIKMVMEQLDIPVFVVIATEKSDYKPNPALLNILLGENTINKEDSFFVGDALGRKSDFSDSDKVFAENIGIKCYSPEALFVNEVQSFDVPSIPLSEHPEMIIMVGYPGSGKSTICRNICKTDNYICIAGDTYKTQSKMIKASLESISQSKSIVFDATHSSKKKRRKFVELGKKYNYEVKCVHVATSLDISYKRNKARSDEEQVPKIVYSVYNKYYDEPNESEGFTLYKIQ